MRDLSTIGGRLRAARRARGLSKQELLTASRLSLDITVVSHWESTQNEIRTPYIVQVCDALGITLDWLLRGPSNPHFMEDYLASPEDGADRIFGSPRGQPLRMGRKQ